MSECGDPAAALVRVTTGLGPFGQCFDEELMSLRDRSGREFGGDVLLVVHDGAERVLVTIGGPDLEDLVRVLGQLLVVEDQCLKRLGVHRQAVPFGHQLSGVQQDLQGR